MRKLATAAAAVAGGLALLAGCALVGSMGAAYAQQQRFRNAPGPLGERFAPVRLGGPTPIRLAPDAGLVVRFDFRFGRGRFFHP